MSHTHTQCQAIPVPMSHTHTHLSPCHTNPQCHTAPVPPLSPRSQPVSPPCPHSGTGARPSPAAARPSPPAPKHHVTAATPPTATTCPSLPPHRCSPHPAGASGCSPRLDYNSQSAPRGGVPSPSPGNQSAEGTARGGHAHLPSAPPSSGRGPGPPLRSRSKGCSLSHALLNVAALLTFPLLTFRLLGREPQERLRELGVFIL